MGMLNRVSAQLAAQQWYLSDTEIGPDFIVAVLPANIVGNGVEGASFVGRRRVLFVDEKHPIAAIHELGHGIGLYTDREQYDVFPPDGLPISNATIFHTGAGSTSGMQHLPGVTHKWFDKNWQTFDIMGSANPTWTSPSFIRSFYNWTIANLVSNPKAAYKSLPSSIATAGSIEGHPAKAAHSDFKRIMVSLQHDNRTIVNDTVQLFNISGTDIEPTPQNEFRHYVFRCYNSAGITIFGRYFDPNNAEREWVGFFDVAQETVSCTYR